MRAYQLHWSKTLRVLYAIISILVIILIFDKNFNRQYFMNASPFATLAFWQDNRTYQTGRVPPSPITTIDKVNLTNFTLAIAACCRNIETHLIGFQKNVRAIGGLFGQYRNYLGESDSEDGTLQFIQEWAKNDSDHVYVYTAGQQRWRHFFRKSGTQNTKALKFMKRLLGFIKTLLPAVLETRMARFRKLS
jgi:hypothetical protein